MDRLQKHEGIAPRGTHSWQRLICVAVAIIAAGLTASACKRSPNSQGQPSSTRQGIDASTARILQSMDEYAAQLQADKDAGTGEFAPQDSDNNGPPAQEDQPEEQQPGTPPSPNQPD